MKLEWKNEKRKVNDLIPYEGNPRRLSERQREFLEKSLTKFNLMSVPVVNTDGVIVSGHQRTKVLQLLGRGDEMIDVRVPNRKLTEAEMREANLLDNKTQELGEWDMDLLAGFGEDELLASGWDSEELDKVFQLNAGEDDFDAEEEYEKIIEPRVKLGDLYQLGNHRLMCGDSTKKEDVEKLMAGQMADMVFTDPPYNVNYKGTKFDKIKGDNQTEEQFVKFSEEFILRMAEVVKNGGVFYICSGYSSFSIFLWALRQNGFEFSTPIIWVKNNTSLGWGDYRHKHEMLIKTKNPQKKAQPILYGWKEGKHYFPETRFEADVWEIKRRASNTMVHPTQKPLELCSRAIRNSSKRGEIVLDLFGGSFSTLISCEKEGRVFYGMELDPRYIEVGIKRWENLTNQKAIKLNG